MVKCETKHWLSKTRRQHSAFWREMLSLSIATVCRRTGFRIAVWAVFAMMTASSTAWSVTHRPEKDQGPTRVRVGILVIDVDEIDDAEQNFTANVYYELRWRDPRLTHPGPEAVSRDLNEVWHPRFQFINQQKLWRTFPEIVRVAPDGEVLYRQRVLGGFSQALKLHDFPFDRQTFNIQAAATGYMPDEVELVQDQDRQSGIAKELSLAGWKIFHWQSGPYNYQPIPDVRSPAGFQFSFQAQREVEYFITKVILPLILIVAMSWVVFWIDPKQSGTQISVAITTMLTLIAFRFAMGATLPKISYLTRMDYFILVATFLVFAGLIEVAITSALANAERLKLARALDRLSRVLFPSVFVLFTLKAFVF